MLTKEQLKARIKYIGASEVAGVIGISRWMTPLQIWSYKTEAIPYPEEQTLPQWLGTRMEQIVADRFTEETGKKVRRVNETIFHPRYNFLAANLDRKVEGENAVLECKTSSVWKRKEWEDDEIPPEYIVQVYAQLACSEYKKAYIACLVGNQKFVIREILYDKHIIDNLVKKVVFFWENFVVPKVLPGQISMLDTDLLLQLFPEAKPESLIELSDDVNVICEDLEAMSQDYNRLDGQIEQKKNVLKSILKDNEAGSTGKWKVTWKKGKKKAFEVPAWEGRRLLYRKIKEAQDGPE